VELGGDRQEGLHEPRIELRAAEPLDLGDRAVEWPRVLVGAEGKERIEDVADGADAPGERYLLAEAELGSASASSSSKST
jgi:hypothetical protein